MKNPGCRKAARVLMLNSDGLVCQRKGRQGRRPFAVEPLDIFIGCRRSQGLFISEKACLKNRFRRQAAVQRICRTSGARLLGFVWRRTVLMRTVLFLPAVWPEETGEVGRKGDTDRVAFRRYSGAHDPILEPQLAIGRLKASNSAIRSLKSSYLKKIVTISSPGQRRK